MVELTPTGGRYPFGLARYDIHKIRAWMERNGDYIIVRVEDTSNIDCWFEFSLHPDELKSLYPPPLEVRSPA